MCAVYAILHFISFISFYIFYIILYLLYHLISFICKAPSYIGYRHMSYYNFFITPIQIERIFQIINRMKNS